MILILMKIKRIMILLLVKKLIICIKFFIFYIFHFHILFFFSHRHLQKWIPAEITKICEDLIQIKYENKKNEILLWITKV